MEYKRLTDDELADFLQRACVQLVPELTQQLLSLGMELAEYRTKIEKGMMIDLPCKEGTPIYYIRKDCDANDGSREEFRPTKEFAGDCEYFEESDYYTPEYCKYFDIINNDYSGYEDCSFDLKIICDKCKDRLTIHKDYFELSMINRVYNTPQFDPRTPLKDTYFLTVEEAEEKIKELKEKWNTKQM